MGMSSRRLKPSSASVVRRRLLDLVAGAPKPALVPTPAGTALYVTSVPNTGKALPPWGLVTGVPDSLMYKSESLVVIAIQFGILSSNALPRRALGKGYFCELGSHTSTSE